MTLAECTPDVKVRRRDDLQHRRVGVVVGSAVEERARHDCPVCPHRETVFAEFVRVEWSPPHGTVNHPIDWTVENPATLIAVK